ncbi:MAG: hypothetical protein LC753_19145 [Acidobacteria bacterium]|nr:hypothetical protein [Acidobacteriota bacterium]
MAVRIERLISGLLTDTGSRVVPRQLPASEVYGELRRRRPTDSIFIFGNLAAMEGLTAQDAGAGRLSALGLEVLNPRVASVPFHIIVRADTVAELAATRSEAVRLGYASVAHDLQETDVQDLLRPLLGAPKMDAVKINSPALLARRLLADDSSRIHFAGVYDEEPSLFLDRFLAAYNRERPKGQTEKAKLARLLVFPTGQSGFEPNQLRTVGGGALDYIILRHEDYKFYDYGEFEAPTDSGMITVARPASAAGSAPEVPVLLTNVARTRGRDAAARLLRGLSDVYLATLFENQSYANRCSGRPAPMHKTYLLNAHLTDRTDPFKGLGLWGHLLLMRTVEKDGARYGEQARLVEDIFERQLMIPASNPERLLAWLAQAVRPRNVRESFSGDISNLYHRAVGEIRLALPASAQQRREHLEEARALLVAAMREGVLPKCAQGGRGLWSANDYDPYFHLALVESYLRISGP